MELKEKLVSSFVAFEEEMDLNTKVHKIRSKNFDYFEKTGFPSKKNEEWKYTSLDNLIKKNYRIFTKDEFTIELSEVKKFFLNELDTYKIVFIDGIYSPFLSDTTHDGIDVCLLSAALNKPKYEKIINNYFDQITHKADSLTTLNTSFTKEGAYIFIPKSVSAEKPIEIVHFSSGKQGSLFLQPRNLIILEENSTAQIVERHQSLGKPDVLTNSVTEIFLNERSIMDYYKMENIKSDTTMRDSIADTSSDTVSENGDDNS